MTKKDGDAGAVVRVVFWGVRGSIPTPGPETVRYGGNTSCVTVEGPDETLFVLDSGSGIRALGSALIAAGRLPVTVHLLLTHTHWDHIQGLPFFGPAFIPGNTLHIYGSRGPDWSLEDAVAGQMIQRYFPVSLSMMGAEMTFTHLSEGAYDLAGATVVAAPLHHPGTTIGYRLEVGGRTVAYVTDEEPPGGPDDFTPDPNALRLARGADLLIHDAQYTDEEYHQGKVGWGHSPLSYVVGTAIAAEVPRLVLFHHDPMHNDQFIDQMVAEARQVAQDRGATLEIAAADEGTSLELPSLPTKAAAGAKSSKKGRARRRRVAATTAP